MEQITSEDKLALQEQMQLRLQQLQLVECYFCREDFEILLQTLEIFNREAAYQIGLIH
jgi:hypothetical protein